MKAYQSFALVYDALMDSALYEEWLHFVGQYIPPHAAVLDAACGTGTLTMRMAQQGFRMIGCDVSSEMLTLAEQKARELPDVAISWVHENMCAFVPPYLVEAVTCSLDAVCYLQQPREVQAFFNQAFSILQPGGWLLFDVHSVYCMTHHFPGYQFHDIQDELIFIWSSFATEQPLEVVHELTLLQHDDSKNCYVRTDEVHVERTYPLDTYKEWVHQAGFAAVEVFADGFGAPVSDTTLRWFFACYKQKDD